MILFPWFPQFVSNVTKFVWTWVDIDGGTKLYMSESLVSDRKSLFCEILGGCTRTLSCPWIWIFMNKLTRNEGPRGGSHVSQQTGALLNVMASTSAMSLFKTKLNSQFLMWYEFMTLLCLEFNPNWKMHLNVVPYT